MKLKNKKILAIVVISFSVLGMVLYNFIVMSDDLVQSELIKANSVIIVSSDGATVDIVGTVAFSMNMIDRSPAGPIRVHIFKGITTEYQDSLKGYGMNIKENAAYLWPEGSEYNFESFKRIKYIRDIDGSLSNDELAAIFGVSVSKK